MNSVRFSDPRHWDKYGPEEICDGLQTKFWFQKNAFSDFLEIRTQFRIFGKERDLFIRCHDAEMDNKPVRPGLARFRGAEVFES